MRAHPMEQERGPKRGDRKSDCGAATLKQLLGAKRHLPKTDPRCSGLPPVVLADV